MPPRRHALIGANATALPARDLLRHIADQGDLIGRAPDGRVFLLLALDAVAFDRLCAIGAGSEDREEEPDDDDQAEPSMTDRHRMDHAA